ncbi:S8 family serine peptidase [Rubrivivax gelatinosus]|uniref:Subtilase family protein n=1 Tax=Rubrivivax gelatinosus TaxID=28068 RepID=A0A4V2SFN4_RUBGE|nr:S8 family serine peptidase [Rubrivivax gelatinosus]MBK1689161.1 peptidase S8 [Rubrivivax gelatinosus]TCO97987.1 subtilase family protein [Rubrivivax gelatinosus]
MRRLPPCLPRAVAAAVALAAFGLAVAPAAAADDTWAARRVLLSPRAGLPAADFRALLAVHGGQARKMGQSELYVVDLPAGVSERAVQQRLARHRLLKFAELDRRIAPAYAVNDPYLGSQWHLGTIGAASAWDLSQGAGVTIAILDSGIDGKHPDLAARMVAGWNFYDGNADTSDANGHGTAVAGAAAATSDNATGVAAVAGKANLMPVRIADANAYAYWSTVAQGLTWAADHGARVANISYNGVAGSSTVASAANYLRGKGGLVVVAAGNDGKDPGFAATTAMIPVSATDSADKRTSWSNYGAFVALAAPGSGIWTTNRGGGYSAWSGTSFASPITAGVVALMMASRPDLPNTTIESLLYASAQDLGTAGRDTNFGHGRVDAAAAVAAAVAAAPAADTSAPAVAIGSPGAGSTVSGTVTVDVAASDNVGVARVELSAGGSTVGIDGSAPFAFAWDTTGVANGSRSLVATAYDAAGNRATSATVTVNVANAVSTPAADTTAPKVALVNPVAGSVSGTVGVSVSASDDSGAAGIRHQLYVDGKLAASGSGSTLSYAWNTKRLRAGSHTLKAVATDAAGNSASASVTVNVVR